MKKEWKVYIKGVQNRGDEVIKALIDLGGKLKNNVIGSNKDCIYFIDHDDRIYFAYLTSEIAKIIMDNYQELHLPERWKDGDILINNDGTDYKVFWEYDSDTVTSFYAYNVSMHVNGILTIYSGSIYHREKIVCSIKDYRLTTNSEVKRFHKLLNKCGKDWDGEKKQLIDLKWKPKFNEKYWIVTTTLDVNFFIWKESQTDIQMLDSGNCFKTKEDARAARDKIKNVLKMK